MNREIKFRAWDEERNIMLDKVNINHGEPVQAGYQFYTQPTSCKNLTAMQYTGLKDRNGKEIYEDDIVKFTRPTFGYCIATVRFELGQFMVDESTPVYLTGAMNGEVIGNTHDNPELVE